MEWQLAQAEILFTPRQTADAGLTNLVWPGQAVRLQLTAQGGTLRPQQNELIVMAAEQGEITVETDGMRASLFHGQALLLLGAGKQCRLSCAADGRCLAVSLCGSLPRQLMEDHIRAGRVFCASGLVDVTEAVTAWTSGAQTAEQTSLAAYRLLLRLHETAHTYERASGYPLLVDAAIGIFAEEFAYLSGVEEVADRLEVTPAHLTRVFSAAVGMPPGRYLKLRRIAAARELLHQPDLTVALVASLCGFADADYFSRIFRKETGLSPGAYRSLCRAAPQQDDAVRQAIDQLYL